MTDTISNSLPTIAILGGTGKEGPGLALRWASAGYHVIIGSRQFEKASATAAELNSKLGTHNITGLENSQAAQAADICVLTVEYSAHQIILESLKEWLKGKILVDTTARVDYQNPFPPSPPSAARIAQDILGGDVRVVAAFQTIPAHVLRKNLGGALDGDVLICADDLEAAEQVKQLALAGGMRAFYAGRLENAVIIEGLTCLLISLNRHYQVKTASIGIKGLEP